MLDSDLPLCSLCREGEFEFDLARSYGVYASNLREAILRMKFGGRERLGLKLGGLLASVWDWVEENAGGESPVLIPIPLYPSRERERGFNQAELLARGLTRRLGSGGKRRGPKVETRAVRRMRATLPQSGLSLRQRQENVRGVFAVVSPERLRGRVVVLVDDVMTTGATVSACAGALNRAGAGRVLVLTLARATPQFPDGVAASGGVPVDDSGRSRG